MVGIAAIGVNRYLARTHQTVVATSLPAMEAASRIGTASEVIGSLAASFVQADTSEDLDRIAVALRQTLGGIRDGLRVLQGAKPDTLPPLQPDRTGRIVARMTENGHSALELAAQVRAQAADVARHGAHLDALIASEIDLARLRITAGITGLYRSEDGTARAALDRLADQHFFAFERITELAGRLDAVRLQLQQVPDLTSTTELSTMQAEVAESLDLVARRLAYLPTPAARAQAQALVRHHQAALASGGMFDLQRQRLDLSGVIAADTERLTRTISALSDQARQAGDAAKAQALGQMQAAERRASVLSGVLLIVIAAAVLISALLWLYARRQLVARLGKLSRRIIEVARGEYGASLPISGHDEIGRMEKALNILRRRATEAERLREHLEEAVISRTGDVVAEMKASDATRAEAEAANRSKTEFLARMSHEIRTPLNGIIGMLGLLEAEETDPAARDRVRIAHQSARELLDITNDILTYAGSEDRANAGRSVHFHLRDLVGQLGQQLQSLAAAKGLETDVELADPSPMVLCGDVVKIRQVVGNLISNAVKYTPSGAVTLFVDHAPRKEDGQPVLSFTVSDTGTGMTPEAITSAFDAYSRTGSAQRSGIEGLGLGLAISRNLTEAMGGALHVESEPGLGSRFTLTIPLTVGDAAQASEDESLPAEAEFGHRVLVIDDHAVNRIVARGYLERMGCAVSEAATAAAGLTAARTGDFDLILVDLDLPDMRGEDLIARLAAIEEGPTLAALTAHMIDDTAENRRKMGVAQILAKPISPRALTGLLAPGSSGTAGPPEAEEDAPNSVAQSAAQDEAQAVLASLQGDIADIGADTTRTIVQEFLDELPAALDTIRKTDGEARRKAAHRLKGAASNFHLASLCAVLVDVEAHGDGADATLLSRLDDTANAAEDMLVASASEAGLQVAAGSTNR